VSCYVQAVATLESGHPGTIPEPTCRHMQEDKNREYAYPAFTAAGRPNLGNRYHVLCNTVGHIVAKHVVPRWIKGTTNILHQTLIMPKHAQRSWKQRLRFKAEIYARLWTLWIWTIREQLLLCLLQRRGNLSLRHRHILSSHLFSRKHDHPEGTQLCR
jgi:hypothetical protein